MASRSATCLRFDLLGQPRWTTEHDTQPLLALDALLIARVAVLGRLNSAQEVELLWPDKDKRQVNKLDVRLSRLRATLGHDLFEKSKDSLAFVPGVDVDVLGPMADWPAGAATGGPGFLAGITAPSTLVDWLAEQRQRWASALHAAHALRRAAELESTDALPAALDLIRNALGAAPWLAEAWLAHARLLYLTSQTDAAAGALAQARALGLTGTASLAHAAELQRTLDRSFRPSVRRTQLPVSLLRPPVLIGRNAAWAAMHAAWAQRRPFILQGDSGIGKSRLLHDFVRGQAGAVVVVADPRDALAPYATLGLLLRQLTERLGLGLSELPTQLHGVLTLPGTGRPAAPLDALAIQSAAAALLLRAAGDIGAIVIDRLDGADAASIELLRRLATSDLRDRLHFGFAAGPPAAGLRHDAIDAWCAATDGAQRIALGPWLEAEIAELLATLELAGAAAHATPAWLHAQTHGVPQLVLFTLQELAAQGTWTGPPGAVAAQPLPACRPALLARLVAVAPQARRLMELCAVLDADVALMAQALHCTPAEAADMAHELTLQGILFDGSMVHDLMRQAVIACMAPAALQRWNAVAAALLAPDLRVPRARIAAHWQAAGRWLEAGAAYREAALDAEDVGRLQDTRALLHQAADCAARGNDPHGEFDALNAALLGERQLIGHQAAQLLLDRLQTLSSTPRHQVQLALGRAMLAVNSYRRDGSALPVAQAAHAAAAALGEPALQVAAISHHAAALAQAGQYPAAVAEGHRARKLAALVLAPRMAREVASDLCYVFYEAGQVGDAVTLSRELFAEYELAGDAAGAASLESNLASLLLLSGDPAAAVPHSRSAYKRFQALHGPVINDAAVMNRVGLAQALAHTGRLAEAETLLTHDGHCLSNTPVAPDIRAKVRLVRAHLLLLLGDHQAAVAALDVDAGGWPLAMQVQRHWALAKAATVRGDSAAAELQRMADLLKDFDDAPLAHSSWLEWSQLGEPAQVSERLRSIHQRRVRAGMHGVARAVQLRRIARLSELRLAWARDEACALATDLRLQLQGHAGLHAAVYVPEAWLIVAQALRRGGGEPDTARTCVEQARQWIKAAEVPAARQESFMTRNPVNRALLDPAGL